MEQSMKTAGSDREQLTNFLKAGGHVSDLELHELPPSATVIRTLPITFLSQVMNDFKEDL